MGDLNRRSGSRLHSGNYFCHVRGQLLHAPMLFYYNWVCICICKCIWGGAPHTHDCRYISLAYMLRGSMWRIYMTTGSGNNMGERAGCRMRWDNSPNQIMPVALRTQDSGSIFAAVSLLFSLVEFSWVSVPAFVPWLCHNKGRDRILANSWQLCACRLCLLSLCAVIAPAFEYLHPSILRILCRNPAL